MEDILHLEAEDSNKNDKYTVAVKEMIELLDMCLVVFYELCDTS